jgi:AhpD family alkylhydroperoxidase
VGDSEVHTTDNSKERTVNARVNLLDNPVAAKSLKHIISAGKAVVDSTLPAATQELVKIRTSQINGCGFCIDMHTKEAAHAGETSTRLNLVAGWREATLFTDAERAALELAEQGTRIADAAGGVPDEVWANAAKHYDEDQLAALVLLIAVMNTVNRLNVIVQQPVTGDYQPGRLGQLG